MFGMEIRSNKKPARKHIAYAKLEDTKAGVWRIATKEDREEYLPLAAELMRSPERFYLAMVRAITEWPITSEYHLGNSSLNRQAWIGHAGCCIETGSPEEVTRLAWHTLNTEEQNAANLAADRAIAEWERRNLPCQRSLWE